MTTLVHTRKRPLRFRGDRRADPEIARQQRDTPRASTAGRMSTRSDVIVVSPAWRETPPPASNPASTASGKGVRRERVRDKHGRYTDGKAITGKMLVIEIPKPKSSGSNTPVRQSSNGSPSGTAIPRPRNRISLRSKGTSPLYPASDLWVLFDLRRIALTFIFIIVRSRRHRIPRATDHIP